ncbi:TetR family transcriptional regulator [Micromonospora sp. ATCC 39149]|uniref:TetR/AcrR family transcriptional regulator n=1 Tax=Micromonospora carbonacea TaxID=47853 RepID=A0A7D6GH39_9ACTN|nr:TetR/AcrR family transcriptional regulator [Micromonospora sp. ATCC 39149]EEP74769.1 TetR family transcriptional regulator [Micromonospora sp. ATCC 39149]QLK01346.1 TetR/AcrR family transcriptional regulator [Micromonospora carbonacea]
MSRTRDLEAQQQRLSTATWAVLAHDGLTGLTVRAVAERAGCTTGLVMHTFPDKRSLLRHARDLLHQRTAERADQAEAAAADPQSRLRTVLSQAVTLADDKRQEARVWIAYAAAAVADADLAELHRKHNRAFVARIDRLLSDAYPHLPDDARADAATALVALVEGLNTLAALDIATYHPDQQRRAIDDALTRLTTRARPTGSR